MPKISEFISIKMPKISKCLDNSIEADSIRKTSSLLTFGSVNDGVPTQRKREIERRIPAAGTFHFREEYFWAQLQGKTGARGRVEPITAPIGINHVVRAIVQSRRSEQRNVITATYAQTETLQCWCFLFATVIRRRFAGHIG